MKIYTLCLLLLCMSAVIATAQLGTLDSSFSTNGKTRTLIGSYSNLCRYVTMQSDGKILAVGSAITGLGTTDSFALARYMPDGTLDKKFGNKGTVLLGVGTSYSYATYATILPNGKILVAGYSGGHYTGDFVLLRLKENGTPDSSFGTNGEVITDIGVQDIARQIILQDDGKIIVAGETNNQSEWDWHRNIAMVRYYADGRLDSSFGNNGKVVTDFGARNNGVLSITVQDDGKLMLAGYVTVEVPNPNFLLARYKQNGQLDSSFGTNGHMLSNNLKRYEFESVAIQQDGKYVVSAVNDTDSENFNFAVLRFKQDASLDETFGNQGKTVTDFFGKGDISGKVLIQNNGKIIVTGYATSDTYQSRVVLARYNRNGSLDSSFGINGKVYHIADKASGTLTAALQEDGKIVVGGTAPDNVGYGFFIARLKGGSNLITNNIANSSRLKGGSRITTFPNPVNDALYISGLDASLTYDLTVSNLNGVVVATRTSIKNEMAYTWHLFNLSGGFYYLTVSSKGDKRIFKFLKQ